MTTFLGQLSRFFRALAAGLEAFKQGFRQAFASDPSGLLDHEAQPGEQTRYAAQLCAEWRLRRYLHAALRKYSPTEETPSA